MTIQTIEIDLEYQQYIKEPPFTPKQMWDQACSSDGPTINYWAPIWEKNIKANFKKYGTFHDNSIGKLFNSLKYKPVVLAGSGPSLKKNAEALKEKGDIPVISCLHNFHFFEDRGIDVDFYVTLDAGEVTIEEVYEGGSHEPEWYWERTKDKTLIAYVGTHPKLLEQWRGKVYFYNCPIADPSYEKIFQDTEVFNCYVSTGGNVLGACLNIAKAHLGCQVVGFIGADFSFSWANKFHGWDSKYDADLGHVVHWVDCYGIKVKTWQSYLNFKNWFDFVAIKVPGVYYNCSEGGILGAYRDGNISAITQIKLKEFLNLWHLNEPIRAQAANPKTDIKQLLF